jgi:glutamate-1-semialdehyde 2,1-aminomutase
MGYQNSDDDSLGFTKDFSRKSIITDFNDLAAVENALKNNPVACVLTEPALTNIGVIKPEEGFFDALRKLCDQYQSLLIIDETHTQICAWGGLSRAWNIQCDMFTLGKTVAAGIPTGTYGMTQEIGEFVASHLEAEDKLDSRSMNGGLAIGGTLYGNALCMAAAKVALNEILTPEAYLKSQNLGDRLSTGLQHLFDNYGLPWLAQQLMSRSGYTFGPEQPKNSNEFGRYGDPFLYNAMRVYYANRGVWEAISSAGPAVSFVMEDSDINFYLERVDEFLTELTNSKKTAE